MLFSSTTQLPEGFHFLKGAATRWSNISTAMEFDGNSDYLTISTYEDFQMGGDEWTIDFWVRHGSLSGTRNYTSGNGNDQLLQLRQTDAGINFELGGVGGAIRCDMARECRYVKASRMERPSRSGRRREPSYVVRANFD